MNLPQEFQMKLLLADLGIKRESCRSFAGLGARCESGKILSIDYLPYGCNVPEVQASDLQTQKLAEKLKGRLGDFFNRKPVRFDDLPVCESMRSLKEQLSDNGEISEEEREKRAKVREKVRAIPYGKVRTYKCIAEDIGWHGKMDPLNKVGGACGNSSLAIVVPCYRVVQAKMHLGEYSNGNPFVECEPEQKKRIGRQIKCWLLRHDGWTVDVDDELDPSPNSQLSRAG